MNPSKQKTSADGNGAPINSALDQQQLVINTPILKSLAQLAGDQQQIPLTWSCSKIDYPADKCIHQLFEEQAEKTPQAVAIVFGNRELTYESLNGQANRLAHHLRNRGVTAETLVPLCMSRSPEMIIGLLGILKAGGAYVPIDPAYPADRIAYMLEDTGATIALCNKEGKTQLENFHNIELAELGGEEEFLKDQPSGNLNTPLSPANLAYVIYTSGSTGKPKGVMIEHRSVTDHCYGVVESAGLSACNSFALFSPLVFDAGHSIIHSAFILGASLHVLSDELILNSDKLKTYFERHPVDCIKIVPSLWLSYASLNNIVCAKKVMIFGGEAFHTGVLSYLKKAHYGGNVYNHYGPTEVTIGKCIYKVDLGKSYHNVPIGKPFSYTRLYVLDEYLQLTPVGDEGELYIAGDGLARGYLNQPGLTAEKFVTNSLEAGRTYKTGDKVRWLPDGNLEYLGRADEQVKIQGHRIELGEIEEVLLESELVRQAIVLANSDRNGNKRLAGYIVPAKQYDKAALSAFLRRKLPEYMIPANWFELETLPLTSNGKINKKELENLAQRNRTYTAPKNTIQTELTSILEDLLKTAPIGIEDDFFELGGNSIIAGLLFATVKRKFHKSFPIATIFKARNVDQLADLLAINPEQLSFSSSFVPIQPMGFKTPLFVVHAGLGDVVFYHSLSEHLGNDQPFYALQAKGLNGTDYPSTEMESMASYYISEIRKVQPEGPYYLAGYCLGARIAFEMAQQLIAEGQKIALLANFNGLASVFGPPALSAEKIGEMSATTQLSNSGKLNLKKTTLYVIKKGKDRSLYKARKTYQIFKKLPFWLMYRLNEIIFNFYYNNKLQAPAIIAKLKVMKSLKALQNKYKPKPYPGSMIIFRSPGIFSDPYLGWKELVQGKIETFDVPGVHKTRRDIMNEPHVQYLAEKLSDFLGNS